MCDWRNTQHIQVCCYSKPDCVISGKDEFGKILQQKAEEAGVAVKYLFSNEQDTGTCAVCISNNNTARYRTVTWSAKYNKLD